MSDHSVQIDQYRRCPGIEHVSLVKGRNPIKRDPSRIS